MVFRERVVLFSQAGMLPKTALQEVVKTSVELDMVKVHAEIATQEQAVGTGRSQATGIVMVGGRGR
jgi:hypothetical protein